VGEEVRCTFFNIGAKWGGWSTPRSGGKESLYPLCRGLSEPQGRFGGVGNISLPTGFNPRTFQPVESRYTDYAIPLCSKSQQYNQNVTKIKSMNLRNLSFVLCSLLEAQKVVCEKFFI